MESAALNHLQDNLEGYLNGKFTAGEGQVLLTKWVGEAWEQQSLNKEIAVRAFQKCGIRVVTDDSENYEIHLEGLEDYEVDVGDTTVYLMMKIHLQI